jgi:hypothetical protein
VKVLGKHLPASAMLDSACTFGFAVKPNDLTTDPRRNSCFHKVEKEIG